MKELGLLVKERWRGQIVEGEKKIETLIRGRLWLLAEKKKNLYSNISTGDI